MARRLTTPALVAVYLAAITLANLLVSWLGPAVAPVNAFLLIGLDLTTRDALHDAWRGKHLWPRMLALITAGGLLSLLLGGAAQIALASCAAFILAGCADAAAYAALGDRARLVRVNGSNVAGAAVDSLAFPLLAFGLPLLWGVVVAQLVAKVAGGLVWSLILAPRRPAPVAP
jgi:hypothetical protein